MLGQHRQVIFKEDMFDVIDNAHKYGEKHRGYKGTFKKVRSYKYVNLNLFFNIYGDCYCQFRGHY